MMKTKRLVLVLCLIIGILGSCDDDLSKVGTSIQGEDDKISVYVDTFQFEASTVLLDAVYAKTDTGFLGELYDPLYGTLISDYICQFYCPDNFQFLYPPIDGKIDSVDFQIFYDSWVGDSLAPMRAEIFQVNKELDKYFYTNANPSDYCDMKTSLGQKTYTALDKTVPDSVRYDTYTDSYGNTYYTYYPKLAISIPTEFGQKFYDESVNNPASFANQEAFNKFFPGLYITNTFGTGNILEVKSSYFTIYYKAVVKGSADQDTIVNTAEVFKVTKEIIQLNRFKNTDIEGLTAPNDEYTFIKTPAGVCTRITIPTKKMKSKVEGHILNNMPLTLYAMPQEEYQFALNYPNTLLLIPEDSAKVFFEEEKIQDAITSYIGTYSASDRSYSFGNIAGLLKNQLKKDPDKENVNLLVIPVNHKTASNYYGSYTTSVTNYLSPSGLKLRKDEDKRQIVITSSKYGETK